jgi:ParB-like chromosome segregation protein Spo0J
MAKSKKAVSRSAKSSSTTKRVRLSQIKTDKGNDYSHRESDALKEESLAGLADSLVAEGQQTPLTVYDSGTRDGDDVVYTLIGGFRRYNALLQAINKNLDAARIHDDMEVDVVEVVQGETQTNGEFQRDLLIRSVAENEQRRNFSTAEKLEIVKDFKSAKVSDPRAASALAMSETQYRRFASVSAKDWLHAHVVNNCIGMSDAAELIQAAMKKDRVDELKEDLDAWVAEQGELIEQERQRLAKVGKKLSGSAAHVKSRLSRKLAQHWLQCVENGRRFDDQVGLRFGIHVDQSKGTILIPATQLKVNDLSSADFETMIGELEETVRQFVPLMRKCRMVEQVTDVSEEDIEEERQRIRERQLRRQEQEAAQKGGRPAAKFHDTEQPTMDPVNTDDEEGDPDRLKDDEPEEDDSTRLPNDDDDDANVPESLGGNDDDADAKHDSTPTDEE